MKYPHVESYKGFQIVVEVYSIGESEVRVARETIERYGGRVPTPFPLEGVKGLTFASEEEACASASAHAKEWIDRLLGQKQRARQ